MEELLEQGVGIVMFTSDYAEALEMSHRVIVLRCGRVCAEFARGATSEQEILRHAIGVDAAGASEKEQTVQGAAR
ncbi:hypothetical protein HQ560_18285 [bacterium]|nr:hypothetical protein [bacterium]